MAVTNNFFIWSYVNFITASVNNSELFSNDIFNDTSFIIISKKQAKCNILIVRSSTKSENLITSFIDLIAFMLFRAETTFFLFRVNNSNNIKLLLSKF